MRVVHRRCCGIDVHKGSLTACVLVLGTKGEREVRLKTFATDLGELQRLRFWLFSQKVTHVAMESTGVYWKPVWNVLTGLCELLLANPYHRHNIPGRKTDASDAEWIADLLARGLLKPSFVPPVAFQDLRDWNRLRVKPVEERNRIQNRIEKVLEDTNLKLGTVVSDVLGVTGRLILQAILAGKTDPGWLADYARGKLRGKKDELRRVLRGRVREHHRELLSELLDELRQTEERIGRIERRLAAAMQPFDEQVTRLLTIPGVDLLTAWTLVAELGVDMSRFPTAKHAASWAGLVPGMNESAGKRHSGRTRHGNRWIRRGLCQSAWVVSRMKDCYLTAVFRRRMRAGGKKKAAVATAHQILVIAYALLRDQTVHREEGGDYFDKLNPQRTLKRLSQRAAKLGFAAKFEAIGVELPPEPPKKKRGRPRKTPTATGLTDGNIGS
jgi:transposase